MNNYGRGRTRMSNYSVTTYTEGETESKFDEANRKYYQTLPTSSSNNTNDYGIDDGRTLVHRSHLSTNTKTVIDNGYNPTAPSYREFDVVRTASAIRKDTDRILSIYTMLASIIKNRVAVLERNRSISLCDFSKIKYYNEGSLIAIEIYDLDKFTGGILDILRESFGNAVDVEIYTSDTERKEPEIVFDLSKPILPREKVSSGRKIDRSRSPLDKPKINNKTLIFTMYKNKWSILFCSILLILFFVILSRKIFPIIQDVVNNTTEQ